MTQFQKVTLGFKIFETYLSPKHNPGDVSAEHDVIYVNGVHRDALGGDDRQQLEAMGWIWVPAYLAWEYSL
jgi:hypothetical protein